LGSKTLNDKGAIMGRKGVSKRKPGKSKNPNISSKVENSAVTSVARISEAPTPRILGKGEALSVRKGGKKK
jgi:hypothetical protein